MTLLYKYFNDLGLSNKAKLNPSSWENFFAGLEYGSNPETINIVDLYIDKISAEAMASYISSKDFNCNLSFDLRIKDINDTHSTYKQNLLYEAIYASRTSKAILTLLSAREVKRIKTEAAVKKAAVRRLPPEMMRLTKAMLTKPTL